MSTPEIIEDFYTGAGGRRLFVRHIVPEKPRAVATLLHGYGEHGGRYLETMKRLAAAGFAVYCPDHRGFGRNMATPGDMEGIDLVVEDIHLLTRLARETFPGDSSILIGHSMGGMLALNQLLEHQEDYDLAVTSGAAVLPPPDANPLVVAIAGLIAGIAPKMGVQHLDLSKGTREETMIAFDATDELAYRGKVRARTAYDVLKTQKKILSFLDRISLPLLVLHGGADTIIDPRASEIVYNGIGSEVKEHILFPGLYHEVFNEPERDEVFARLFTWLDSILERHGR